MPSINVLHVFAAFTVFSICGMCNASYEINVDCLIRRDISPCTCTKNMSYPKEVITVTCQRMKSFGEVVNALQNKLDRNVEITLVIGYSDLNDMCQQSFQILETLIKKLEIPTNNISELCQTTFVGLENVRYLNLIDNKIRTFPGEIFKHMPNIETLIVSKSSIQYISPNDFVNFRSLKNLMFDGCNLTYLEVGTFPPTLSTIHLGSNNLTTLNYTLSYQKDLKWLLIQNNRITTLEGQLPDLKPNNKLELLDISGNELTVFPKSVQYLYRLDQLKAIRNKIQYLDNHLSNLSRLIDVDLSENNIRLLYATEFARMTSLVKLNLGFNEISNLNGSLLPLKHATSPLSELNFTRNLLTEFSIQDIKGLNVDMMEFSNNQITKIMGIESPIVDVGTICKVIDLRLDHNLIEIIRGSFAAIQGLTKLNMSYNKISHVPPSFLYGLNDLKELDLSHNCLLSLQDSSTLNLPSLTDLFVSYNSIEELSHDLDGFPSLCNVYFGFNNIRTIKMDFTEKTQCKIYGVIGTLRIYLEGNPDLCDESVKSVVRGIEARNTTKIHGLSWCGKDPIPVSSQGVDSTNSSGNEGSNKIFDLLSNTEAPKEELRYNVNNINNTDPSTSLDFVTLDKKIY